MMMNQDNNIVKIGDIMPGLMEDIRRRMQRYEADRLDRLDRNDHHQDQPEGLLEGVTR
ncbi:MAG: hypothetical protein RBR19_08315 [Sedimentisphaerales bacterium]|jgi:hypothetical protein|nr:hypothetical protein [Sedimentisphaerales bacterium]NLT75659.1 hypothetical protein [Planctomycetota bacterium]